MLNPLREVLAFQPFQQSSNPHSTTNLLPSSYFQSPLIRTKCYHLSSSRSCHPLFNLLPNLFKAPLDLNVILFMPTTPFHHTFKLLDFLLSTSTTNPSQIPLKSLPGLPLLPSFVAVRDGSRGDESELLEAWMQLLTSCPTTAATVLQVTFPNSPNT